MRDNIVAADEILGLYFPVLDNGFISLRDYMGSDDSIVQAARNSYSKGTKKLSDDRSLIRRLMRDQHGSPLEFAELSFHVRAPLYVIQQWLRHRTNNFCQESHRYSEVRDDFQKTKIDAWRLQNQDNKQGSNGVLHLTETTKKRVRDDFGSFEVDDTGEDKAKELCFREEWIHNELKNIYKQRLDLGIAREQARKDIPHSTYSSIYIKCDVRNLLNFLKLRTDNHAQIEIREYANIIACMLKRVCPLVFEGWVDYSYGAKSFSRLDLLLLNYINGFKFFQIGDDIDIDTWARTYKNSNCKYHLEIGMKENKNGQCRELDEFFEKLIPVQVPNFDLDITKGIRKES